MRISDRLLRDKVAESIKQSEARVYFYQASDSEYELLLRKELEEEVNNYILANSSEYQQAALAGILEVIHTLANLTGCTSDHLESLRQKRHDEEGGYSQRIVCD